MIVVDVVMATLPVVVLIVAVGGRNQAIEFNSTKVITYNKQTNQDLNQTNKQTHKQANKQANKQARKEKISKQESQKAQKRA